MAKLPPAQRQALQDAIAIGHTNSHRHSQSTLNSLWHKGLLDRWQGRHVKALVRYTPTAAARAALDDGTGA